MGGLFSIFGPGLFFLTRSGLAGTGDQALEAVLLLEDRETVRLRGDATAAGDQVEGGALTNQDLADWAVDVGTGLDGFQHLAFLDMPLDTGKKSNAGMQYTMSVCRGDRLLYCACTCVRGSFGGGSGILGFCCNF